MDAPIPIGPPPWRLFDPCPCGSGRHLVGCCMTPGQGLYVQVPSLLPKPPKTGFSHQGCYLRQTGDCSDHISREHPVSNTILEAMGVEIEFTGLPGRPRGDVATLSPKSLVSKILCKRHNGALSPLDSAAGRTFRILQEITRDIAPYNQSTDTGEKWHLVSGEALELWCLKTLFGLYHGRIATYNGTRLVDTHFLDDARLRTALEQRRLPPPCGLYLQAVDGGVISDVHEAVSVSPMGSEDGTRVVGVTIGLVGLMFHVMIDPVGVNLDRLREQAIYHPWHMLFRNRFRKHRLVMTWHDRQSVERLSVFGTEPDMQA